MKTTYNWLREYCPTDLPIDELARMLTMAGLAVESVEQVDSDYVLDLEITSNRGDLQGVIGIARELSALTGKPLKIPEVQYQPDGKSVEEWASVEVRAPELCPRYTARIITDVEIRPSPDWLANRLQAVGLHPVNNVVDISNFVMLESGQPLHAFDYARLSQGKIIVRRAEPGEPITLIDGSIRELSREDLVIADAHKPVAIAGIMGGLDSEVGGRTSVILLESARFSPADVRRTSRRLGVSSDSCYRFERGVDPLGMDWASRRAVRMMAELAGGQPAPGVIDVNFEKREPRKVTLRLERLQTLLGVKIELTDALRLLEALGFAVAEKRSRAATFVVPSFRADVNREADLVEEVARIYGYDHIPTSTHLGLNLPEENRADLVEGRVRSLLLASGFSEVITFSLVDEKSAGLVSCWSGAPAIALANPISEDNKFLRKSLLPSLLKVLKTNQDRGISDLSVFEIGKGYLARAGARQPEERRLLGLLSEGADAFRRVKGTVEELLTGLGLEELSDFQPGDQPFLAPDSQAVVEVEDEPLGWLGLASREICAQIELRSSPVVAEFNLELLLEKAKLERSYQPIPRYPGSARDIALVVDEKVLYRDIVKLIEGLQIPELEKVEFFDVYRGEQIPPGKKSLAFRLTFRSPTGTLIGKQVDEFHQSIVSLLENRLGARLRTF